MVSGAFQLGNETVDQLFNFCGTPSYCNSTSRYLLIYLFQSGDSEVALE